MAYEGTPLEKRRQGMMQSSADGELPQQTIRRSNKCFRYGPTVGGSISRKKRGERGPPWERRGLRPTKTETTWKDLFPQSPARGNDHSLGR